MGSLRPCATLGAVLDHSIDAVQAIDEGRFEAEIEPVNGVAAGQDGMDWHGLSSFPAA